MDVVRKVTALITRQGRAGVELCVFDHPLAGTQLPAGTLLDDEAPTAGAAREAFEETGLAALQVLGEVGVQRAMQRAGADAAQVLVERHTVHLVADGPTSSEWYVITPDGGGLSWRCHWMPLEQHGVLVEAHERWIDGIRDALRRGHQSNSAGPSRPSGMVKPHATATDLAVEIFWAPPWSGSRGLVSWIEPTVEVPVESVHRAEAVAMTGAGDVVVVADLLHQGQPLWTFPGGRREAGETLEETIRREVAEEACARTKLCLRIGYLRVQHLDGERAGQTTTEALFWARVELEPLEPRFESVARQVLTQAEAAALPIWRNPIALRLLERAFAQGA